MYPENGIITADTTSAVINFESNADLSAIRGEMENIMNVFKKFNDIKAFETWFSALEKAYSETASDGTDDDVLQEFEDVISAKNRIKSCLTLCDTRLTEAEKLVEKGDSLLFDWANKKIDKIYNEPIDIDMDKYFASDRFDDSYKEEKKARAIINQYIAEKPIEVCIDMVIKGGGGKHIANDFRTDTIKNAVNKIREIRLDPKNIYVYVSCPEELYNVKEIRLDPKIAYVLIRMNKNGETILDSAPFFDPTETQDFFIKNETFQNLESEDKKYLLWLTGYDKFTIIN